MTACEVTPDRRRAVETWLVAQGARWDPGRTFVAADALARAVVRLVEAAPGEGYHREHVRTLVGVGEPRLLRAAAMQASAAADPALRVEAQAPARDDAWRTALRDAGLAIEARLPRGWRHDRDATAQGELLLFGRPAVGRGAASARERQASLAEHAAREAGTGREREAAGDDPARAFRNATADGTSLRDIRIVAHDDSHRRALAAFLDGLVAGRSYPPGTLLAEAERVETRRPGDLDARWLLALDDAGRVVGGLVFERQRPAERAHVSRVHLDVALPVRRRGIATRLLRAARGAAHALGVASLEADPRAGNLGACGALEAAGFTLAGTQRGAWRMRTPAAAWDDDVRLYAASPLETPAPGPR